MNFIEKLSQVAFKQNPKRDGLGQTDRNALKKESIAFLVEKLEEIFPESDVVLVADGVAVSTYNEKLDQTITFVVDTTFKDFNFNALVENESLIAEQKDKADEKIKKEKAKQIKIALDTKIRAEKSKVKTE